MPSVIERASTGRAKCRACGQAIAKGDERFGEALPNAYGEGEALFWFHLGCGARARPESLLPVLEQSRAEPAQREQLEALAQGGVLHPRLCRISKVERASSGRARCRHCRELIEQGAWRIALQMFEEGRFNAMGTIHAACAVHYFDVEPSLERFAVPGNPLDANELNEVAAVIREGAARQILPGLAKGAAQAPEEEATRQSS